VNSLLQRYVAAVVGFGFSAVWISSGVTAAILCLLGSVLFYSAVVVVQQRRFSAFTSRFMEGGGRKRTRKSRPGRNAPARRPSAPPRHEPERDESAELVIEYGW